MVQTTTNTLCSLIEVTSRNILEFTRTLKQDGIVFTLSVGTPNQDDYYLNFVVNHDKVLGVNHDKVLGVNHDKVLGVNHDKVLGVCPLNFIVNGVISCSLYKMSCDQIKQYKNDLAENVLGGIGVNPQPGPFRPLVAQAVHDFTNGYLTLLEKFISLKQIQGQQSFFSVSPDKFLGMPDCKSSNYHDKNNSVGKFQ